MVVKTFTDTGQDSEEEKEHYLQLALHLASDFLLKHPDKDVRLLVACGLADIFHIYRPDARFTSPKKLKVSSSMFMSFIHCILCGLVFVISMLDLDGCTLLYDQDLDLDDPWMDVRKVQWINGWMDQWMDGQHLAILFKVVGLSLYCIDGCLIYPAFQDIFMFITQQLTGLEDTKSGQFNQYFYLLEVSGEKTIGFHAADASQNRILTRLFISYLIEHCLGKVLQHLLQA